MKKKRLAMRTTWCLAAAAVLLSLTGCGKFFPFFPDDAAAYTLEYNTLDASKDILTITFPVEFAEATGGAPQCDDLQEAGVEDAIYSFALHSAFQKTDPSTQLPPPLCGAVTCTIDDVAACIIRCATDCEKGFFPRNVDSSAILSLTWSFSESRKEALWEKVRYNKKIQLPPLEDVVVNSQAFDLKEATDATPPDGDKDGIADTEDNCQNAANPDQQDTDNDGVGDACAVKIESGSTAPSEPAGNQGPQGTMEDTTNPGCTMIAGARAVANPVALILLGFTLLPLSFRKK